VHSNLRDSVVKGISPGSNLDALNMSTSYGTSSSKPSSFCLYFCIDPFLEPRYVEELPSKTTMGRV
jgi:hypothetical protein